MLLPGFNACRLVAYYSKKNKAVNNILEGLQTISPATPIREPVPPRVTRVQQDINRRSHSVVSRDFQGNDQQQLIQQVNTFIYSRI